MNTWIVAKDILKPHFQIKKLFTVNYIQKKLPMKVIYMLEKYWKRKSLRGENPWKRIPNQALNENLKLQIKIQKCQTKFNTAVSLPKHIIYEHLGKQRSELFFSSETNIANKILTNSKMLFSGFQFLILFFEAFKLEIFQNPFRKRF